MTTTKIGTVLVLDGKPFRTDLQPLGVLAPPPTIALNIDGQTKTLAKNVIDFTLDNENDLIQGAMICQRPEDRIHRNYRRNQA